jgi:hypothetical protein
MEPRRDRNGYTFCCPVIGVYRCKRPDCRCEENWNAERDAEEIVSNGRIEAAARRIAVALGYESGDWRDFELHARAALTIPETK